MQRRELRGGHGRKFRQLAWRYLLHLGVVLTDQCHFVLRPQYYALALVQLAGLHVEDALRAVNGRAAGLLDDERHGVGLVQQTQAALGIFRVRRVHENAAPRNDAEHIRHREGFKLTDAGTDLTGALDQANYCIWCHK